MAHLTRLPLGHIVPKVCDLSRMSNGPANMSVWAGDETVCVRIAGRASFTCSVDFKALINGLWHQGATHFVLDLTDCLLMDSTFLGVLAGLGLKFGAADNGHRPAVIELLNPNQRISDLLENLGVAHLFKVLKCDRPLMENMTPAPHTCSTPDKNEVSRVCLEAHQTLMDISPGNVPKFKDVARFLAEDLKKAENCSAVKTEPMNPG